MNGGVITIGLALAATILLFVLIPSYVFDSVTYPQFPEFEDKITLYVSDDNILYFNFYPSYGWNDYDALTVSDQVQSHSNSYSFRLSENGACGVRIFYMEPGDHTIRVYGTVVHRNEQWLLYKHNIFVSVPYATGEQC